ncbi:MAG TPA: SufD family Fe-S cluster assembly protein, partial [Candidatus Angelobacter sp.]|nr:SufD family Fe-S cluster assembly protein [Candidatus Angelobacter sp.]
MTKTITPTRNVEAYLESFTEFQKIAAGRDVPWLRDLREEAFARFCEVGFPTTHDEDWRFTNVSAIARTRFQLASTIPDEGSQGELEALRIPEMRCQLVFVNGCFRPELSLMGKLPAGVKVGSLAEEIRSNPQAIEPHLGRYLDIRRDPFSALNTAFAEDGAFVHIRKGVVVEEPIYFLFVSTGGHEALMSHPRNLVIAEGASEAIIVEDYVSLDGSTAFCNTATELVAGESAVVSHFMIERENRQSFNISTLRIQQGRSANIASHSVLLGGGLVRNNVHPVLAGEGSECLINGLFVGSGRQHLDN